MIDLHHRPHYVPNSTDPAHQLQNSLHLLLRILNTQTDQSYHVDHDNFIRSGSLPQWYEKSDLHETDPDDHDPQADEADDPDNSTDRQTETFPEVQSSEGKPPAYDQLRASRYALLKRLQETLYDVQDKNASVQAGWKALWGAFVHSMQSNHYLREWHNGDAVARLWIALGRDGREKFVNEYFGIDIVAMARWEKEHASSIVEDPKYRETQ